MSRLKLHIVLFIAFLICASSGRSQIRYIGGTLGFSQSTQLNKTSGLLVAGDIAFRLMNIPGTTVEWVYNGDPQRHLTADLFAEYPIATDLYVQSGIGLRKMSHFYRFSLDETGSTSQGISFEEGVQFNYVSFPFLLKKHLDLGKSKLNIFGGAFANIRTKSGYKYKVNYWYLSDASVNNEILEDRGFTATSSERPFSARNIDGGFQVGADFWLKLFDKNYLTINYNFQYSPFTSVNIHYQNLDTVDPFKQRFQYFGAGWVYDLGN